MVSIPDHLALFLKWPVDLLHDKFCPCGRFNCTESGTDFEVQPGASTDSYRPSHQGGGARIGCDAP